MEENKFSLNELAISALRTSTGWSLFLSIVGFIGIAFMLMSGAMTTLMASAVEDNMYPGMGPMNPFSAIKSFIGVAYIVMAVLYFLPVYYLFNYSTTMKKALESGNNDMLANALVNLKSHHKWTGIVTIIIIVMTILMVIGLVLFAAALFKGMH